MRIAFLGNFGVSFSSETHHAEALEALGHEVVRMQEGKHDADHIIEHTKGCDLFVWVHTHGWRIPDGLTYGGDQVLAKIKDMGIPVISYHLDLWHGLKRQKDLEQDPFYKQLDYFFATDKLMCDWFSANTDVKGHYLPAGVYHKEAKMLKSDGYKHDVIFVGSRGYHPEWPYRPKLVDWLKDTYGDRFAHYGGDGKGVVRGLELNQLYADTKVVVGDTLCINYDYPYYWSDRIYETTGRGGFIIHPYIKGIEQEFDETKEVVFYEYNDFKQLKGLIDFYVEHDKPREAVRKRGHLRTKYNYTYKQRWQTILEVVNAANG